MKRTRCGNCGFLLAGEDACPGCADAGSPPAAAGWFSEFFRGAAYLPRGLGFLVVRPGLYPYLIMPILLNVLLLGLGFWLGAWGLDWLIAGKFVGWTGWLWGTLYYVVIGLAYLVVAAVVLVVLLVIGPFVVKIPWSALLSERVEAARAGGIGPPAEPPGFGPFLKEQMRGVADELKLFISEMAVTVPLFLFSAFVPFPGGLFLLVSNAYFAALNFVDLPMGRRKYGLREKHRLLWRYFARTSGFGAAVLLVLLIPLFWFVIIPVASAGGTLLYLDLPQKD